MQAAAKRIRRTSPAARASGRMPGFCYTRAVTVYPLGPSTRSAEELLALLRAHGIRGIADVRRFPGSRRHPHFARDALAETLAAAAVDYDWLPSLGGRRAPRPDSPHLAWREPAFRAYADHMVRPGVRSRLDTRLRRSGARTPARRLRE